MAARRSTAASASVTPSPGNDAEDTAIDKLDGNDRINEAEVAPGDQRNGSSSVQTILLDIAFLHSIATHRPIGPHKHFNIIPILVNLERTARQVGARMRDDQYMRAVSADIEGTTTPSIKQEDDDEEGNEESMLNASTSTSFGINAAMDPIDANLIWQRLNEMYDVEGLEELETMAIDNDAMSPFRHAYASLLDKSWQEGQPKILFGFGSGLDKTKKPAKPSRGSNRRGSTNDDSEDKKEDFIEFELGPWEEYEDMVAPRRLKSYAPEEDDPSESDEELSEPSEGEEGTARQAEGELEGQDEVAVEDEEEGVEEEASQREESELEEEGDEEEEIVSTSNKRKTTKKTSNTPSKKTKASAAAAASKTTKASTKPRRSNRR